MIVIVLLVVPILSGIFTGNAQKAPPIRRIVGGFEANIEDYPYIVSVQIYGKHICGGTIIKPDYILTAAHCTFTGVQMRVKAGTDNLRVGGVERKVKSIKRHPHYVDNRFNNDIAVMKLETPLEYIPGKIQSIKLPKPSDTVPLAWGTTMGWGETYNKNEKRNKLRALHLEIYSNEICESVGYRITEVMFCAGHIKEMKDSCNGDSGGPFVINNVQYGIVSHGPSDCASGLPGVYTKVPALVDWIKKVAHFTEYNVSEFSVTNFNQFSFKMIKFLFLVLPLLSGNAKKISPNKRIVGGYEAHIKNFPYMVSIQILKKHMCGGVIIKPDYIATAAHCLMSNKKHYRVKADTDDLRKKGVERKVTDVKIHPDFDFQQQIYDVAVIKLNAPLDYIPGKIQSIKLPKPSDSVPLGEATVIGWGETNNNDEKLYKLRALDLEIYSDEICESAGFNMTEVSFCAGHIDEPKNSCKGDSGGPLIIGDILYGIVSYGDTDCTIGIPAVYTKIPAVVDWIKEEANFPD
ncbi:coagulation factor X-like [Harmonia axyridis]|uniref:coagulation factor X-like n=1 Tax=Harmonia axyridis TaxID=115357 RepID=UPI001E2794B6|nr:coagulation factor X-like [Harmonia axyridis]